MEEPEKYISDDVPKKHNVIMMIKLALEEFRESVYIMMEDENKMIIIIGLSIIVISLFKIYKHSKPRKLSEVRQQMSIESIREAEKKLISDLAGAVGEVKEFVIPRRPQRFRKRDRVWFYGRRMMRRMEDNIKYVEDMGVKSKKSGHQMIKNITKKMFLAESSSSSSLADLQEGGRPAEDWFDEETDGYKNWRRVPSELRYLLNSFHMFGQFDPSLFADLYPAIESLRVTAGQYLFRIGDPDQFIFVVQAGQLNVTCSDQAGTSLIKKVGAGESLTSLLSFIDVLTGHPHPFRTIQAQARVDSVVLRLSMDSFLSVFDKNPELLVRVVQMVMARVQRVIFVGLHSYLGLSTELIRPLDLEEARSPAPMSLEMELALAEQGGTGTQRAVSLVEGVRGFQRELGLKDDSFLSGVTEIREYEEGDIILKEAAIGDIALGYVVQGKVTMYCDTDKGGLDKLYSAEKGECFGQLAMLTGEANFYSCKATKPTVLALLSKSSFVTMLSESPEMVLSLAHSTIARLSPLVRKIDFALDWLTLEAGHAIKNTADLKTLMVLSGRLRGYVLSQETGERKLSGEYGRGDMVGLVDLITGVRQRKHYLSVRDSEVCVIPGELLEFLKSRSNVVMAKIISFLGNRLVNGLSGPGLDTKSVKYNSIAVFGNSSSVPSLQFCHELELALNAMGSVCRLSSRIVQKKLGKSCLKGGHDYRINSWLGQQEDRHATVIYQCDETMTDWTRKCLRHADIVLVLALAAESSEVTGTERDLETGAKRIRKELVLLWPQDTAHPTATRDWLKKRSWLSGHLHVKMTARMSRYSTEGRINKQYSALAGTVPDLHSDFGRIARSLQGQSIGLVLGGGGARGAAHLGMLKSILEAGIPIDKVGGVSIGAFVGGLWSLHRDFTVVSKISSDWFRFMTKPLKHIFSLTYPITSLFTGYSFNEGIKFCFPEPTTIEDLWLPYYCVSTDISTSTERVHKSGVLWRYVRASMSYAWLLPPICDPVDGHLLMDGCYVNNVPGDVMLRSACSHIIVVDVTARDDTELTNYGDYLSGWWLLWKKWNPFAAMVKIPSQGELQERLAFCSHYKNLDALKSNPHYEYIQPPVGHFLSSKFGMYKEIFNVGYHHGTTFFFGLKKSGQKGRTRHDSGPGSWLPTSEKARFRGRERTESDNYTFTDLAEMVRLGVRVTKKASVTSERERSSPGAPEPDSDDTGIMMQ